MSSVVPRPRPGYESPEHAPDETVTSTDRLRLVAASARGGAGVLFCFMALMYLPPQMWTPVMSGVGFLMVVNGALAIWKLGREVPRLRGTTRALVWVFPVLLGAVFLSAAVLGPGALGPDWDAMRARQEPATFEPVGVDR